MRILILKIPSQIVIQIDDAHIFCQSQISNRTGKFEELSIRLCKEDGSPIWCRVSRTILLDENNKPVSILGKIEDKGKNPISFRNYFKIED